MSQFKLHYHYSYTHSQTKYDIIPFIWFYKHLNIQFVPIYILTVPLKSTLNFNDASTRMLLPMQVLLCHLCSTKKAKSTGNGTPGLLGWGSIPYSVIAFCCNHTKSNMFLITYKCK